MILKWQITCFFLPRELSRRIDDDRDVSLKCIHLNAQSARNKSSDLEVFFFFDQLNVSFNIIMLTETWYSDESQVLRLPLYHTYF